MPAIGDDYGLFVPSNSVYKTGLWLEPTKKLRDYNERGLTEVFQLFTCTNLQQFNSAMNDEWDFDFWKIISSMYDSELY